MRGGRGDVEGGRQVRSRETAEPPPDHGLSSRAAAFRAACLEKRDVLGVARRGAVPYAFRTVVMKDELIPCGKSATASGPCSFLMAFSRSARNVSASSQLTRSSGDLRPPRRNIGYFRRSGSYRRSTPALPRAQRRPFVSGWSGLPSTRTTLPSTTLARTPQRQKHISQFVATRSTGVSPWRPGEWDWAVAVAVAVATAPVAATVPRNRRLETLSFISGTPFGSRSRSLHRGFSEHSGLHSPELRRIRQAIGQQVQIEECLMARWVSPAISVPSGGIGRRHANDRGARPYRPDRPRDAGCSRPAFRIPV
jgi:hypothetical protein